MRFNPSSRGRSLKVTEIFSWKRVSSPLNQTPDCFSTSLATSRREVSLRFTESKPSFTETRSAARADVKENKPRAERITKKPQAIVMGLFFIAFPEPEQGRLGGLVRAVGEGFVQGNLNIRWELNPHEVSSRIKVVFPTLIDHAQISLLFRIFVRHDAIDFVHL
jgi:hypothetical protein